MASKKCIIVSRSSTLGGLFQLHGYETIVLSNATPVLAILGSMNVDLLAIDRDIPNTQKLLKSLLEIPKLPHIVTIRGEVPEESKPTNMHLFCVNKDTSDHSWFESITNDFQKEIKEPSKGTILIVDDVVELLDMYETMFQLKGYEVETAKNGLEGITKAASFKPKHILLDIMMPHMDGFELMKAFYNNTSLESIIIVNSNIDGADSAERIYAAGADYFIRKSDYVPSQIITMIEKGLFNKKRDKSLPVENKAFTPGKDFFV